MTSRRSRTLIAACLGIAGPLLAAGPVALADIRYVETVDLVPTSSVVALPRIYFVPSTYVPTSYVTSMDLRPTATIVPSSYTANLYDSGPVAYLPTTFVTPTSYESTSYYPTSYAPTSYVTTSYVPTTTYYPAATSYYTVRRSRFRPLRATRYVERGYVEAIPTYAATTYYASPTSFVAGSGLLASSSLCCETAAAPYVQSAPSASAPPTATGAQGSAPVVRDPRSAAVDPTYRAPAKPIESTVAGGTEESTAPRSPSRDEGLNAAGSTAPRSTARPETSSRVDPAPSTAGGLVAPTTAPTTPLAPPSLDTKTLIPAPSPVEPETPPLPAAVPSPAGDPPAGLFRRDSYKPVVVQPESRPRATKNVLAGKVVSAEGREPEEGVEIVLAERQGRYLDRIARTDAFGKFAVTLPEGDWTVKVTMPSGRTLAVGRGEVTAGSGKVIDMYGRDLTNLVIQR